MKTRCANSGFFVLLPPLQAGVIFLLFEACFIAFCVFKQLMRIGTGTPQVFQKRMVFGILALIYLNGRFDKWQYFGMLIPVFVPPYDV
jgi:hypothetical protein